MAADDDGVRKEVYLAGTGSLDARLRDDAVHVASLDPARNMQLEDVTWAEATVMRPAEGAVEEELVADVEG